MNGALRLLRTRRGAYFALGVLTIVWGSNWIVMKAALGFADPVSFNLERTVVALAVLFGVLVARGGRLLPESWLAVIVTGFFQTTINFGATTMALAGGGAGRTSVLVFTMPFWTLILAWPVLGERVRGGQWVAIALALVGLTLVVEPWSWTGDLGPKLWAVLSGFGWAAGTVAMKYFQRERSFDMPNFIAWQMALGIVPIFAIPLAVSLPATQWSASYVALLVWVGAVSSAGGFLLWMVVLRQLPAGTAAFNMLAVPVVALLLSTIGQGERLTALEWWGIAAIGIGLAWLGVIGLRAARAMPKAAARSAAGSRGRTG